MYVLFTGGRAYSGGGCVCVCVGGEGGSGGSGPSDKRGGVHPVHEKTEGQFQKKIFRPQFGLKISGGGGGRGAGDTRAPLLGPPLGDVITGSSR